MRKLIEKEVIKREVKKTCDLCQKVIDECAAHGLLEVSHGGGYLYLDFHLICFQEKIAPLLATANIQINSSFDLELAIAESELEERNQFHLGFDKDYANELSEIEFIPNK